VAGDPESLLRSDTPPVDDRWAPFAGIVISPAVFPELRSPKFKGVTAVAANAGIILALTFAKIVVAFECCGDRKISAIDIKNTDLRRDPQLVAGLCLYKTPQGLWPIRIPFFTTTPL